MVNASELKKKFSTRSRTLIALLYFYYSSANSKRYYYHLDG